MSALKYGPAVESKFDKNGHVLQFPGNTIICFADPQSSAYQEAEWAQQHLAKQPYAHKFAMLPPSSFHMTVIELLCDDVRQVERWSSHLPLDSPLAETDEYFIQTVARVAPPSNFRMVFSHLSLGTVGLSLTLTPADDETASALQNYRDAIAEVTGVRFPDHSSYVFHLSLAYRIIQLSDKEAQQLETVAQQINQRLSEHFGVLNTGQPVLTFFDDMFAFYTTDQRYKLKSRHSIG